MGHIDPKYYSGLPPSEAEAQKSRIRASRAAYRRGRYRRRPTPASYKHRTSRHVRDFRRIHKLSLADRAGIARALGVSRAQQSRILRKGKGAYYSSGSRPGQTPESWARARLASALLGRGACNVDRKILAPTASCAELRRRAVRRPL